MKQSKQAVSKQIVTARIAPETIQAVEDFARSRKWTRSFTLSECIQAGLEVLRQSA